jgi:hypothetical protein
MEVQHLNEKKRRFLQLPEYTHAMNILCRLSGATPFNYTYT